MCLSVFFGFPLHPIMLSFQVPAPQGFNYEDSILQYLVALALASFHLPKVSW